jgi:DNA-binding XRE family transcriptional regulator
MNKTITVIKKEYECPEEIAIAKAHFTDMKNRGNAAIGDDWDDISETLLSSEERAASKLRVALMVELTKARNERGMTQRKLEKLTGVKRPVIARMETGSTSTQLDTVLKILAPLGKTLSITDL